MKSSEYAKALFEAVSEVRPEDHDKVLDNFVKVLADHGDLNKLDAIEEEYKKFQMQAKGIKEVEVTTASEHDQKHLLSELNALLGKDIEVSHKIDKNLIGGVVVRVDDTLIDASVKNNLNNLKKVLKTGNSDER